MKFRHYISLGNNCEIAFQMRRLLARDHAYFFNWNITSFAAATSLIRSKFENIMQVDNLCYHADGGLVRDMSHDYLFHSNFPRDPNIDFSQYDDVLDEHRSKAQHLIEKFFAASLGSETVCFYYRTEEGDARRKSQILLDALLELGVSAAACQLVIVQSMDRQESDWGLDGIANRYVKRLAPYADATDGHVSSWDRIFREFPYDGPTFYAGY